MTADCGHFARSVRRRLPAGGLFADQHWRVAPVPFPLEPQTARELETLGRVLLQFYRAVNLLYRKSAEGKQPGWVAAWLDRGKPASLVEWQRSPTFRGELPRVIRPDLLLTERGFSITELDSVPGGIGLTAWLNRTYAEALPAPPPDPAQQPATSQNARRGQRPEGAGDVRAPLGKPPAGGTLIGTATSMLDGFASIFGEAPRVHIIVSEESATYRPEMEWVATELNRLGRVTFSVQPPSFTDFQPGDAAYRFFELFDLANVPCAETLVALAREKRLRLTPPPKPVFEEKMLFALLWNRNLRAFWRQELGESFLERLLATVPYTWVVDPAPLPPHAALPELSLTDWHQLKSLSQRERELVLKVSGFSEDAWGARGVFLGSDLSAGDWSAAVDRALRSFERSPYVLQRYHKPRVVDFSYFDFDRDQSVPLPGRVRLCPYYFVSGEGDAARARLAGVLATHCPADKKIIHGMKDAILAPCCVAVNDHEHAG
jgi:hypothetical protein